MKDIRNQFRKITILISACILLLACSTDTPQIPRLSEDAVILAFGDSLTHGNGAGQNQSYPAMLQQLSGRKVVNAGIPGEVTAQGRDRLSDVLDEHSPDLLILCHGGNDMLRKKNGKAMQENLRAMIREAKGQNIPVVLISVPRPTIFLSSADSYGEIAKELGIPVENEVLADILSDNALKSDQIHPNAEGYKIMAEAVHRLLQKTGAL